MLDESVHYVSANGLRFAYFEAGQGPLALLLHGFPDTPHGWRPVMAALAGAGYRAVAPFTRGYAPTEVPATRATTIEELAADALALIEALGHDSAILVGHDWGAATAFLATATAPERVDRLVTVAIAHPATLRPSFRLAYEARHFITLRLPGAAARMRRGGLGGVDTFYRRWSPTWEYAAEETAAVKACFSAPGSLEAALGYYRGAQPGSVPAALRAPVGVPTLAVGGQQDPFLTLADFEAARRKFSGEYRVVGLPGGHFVHRESPEAFCDAVLSFLEAR